MGKAKHRKKTEYQASMTKSVFLYGKPNRGKLDLLSAAQNKAKELVNRYIQIIHEKEDLLLSLVKNDKKAPQVREFQKSLRDPNVNSAFCQMCFDQAFTMLSNRLQSIKSDMYAEKQDIFTSSKVLFAMSITGRSQDEMVETMETVIAGYKKPTSFHIDTLEELRKMPSGDFAFRQTELLDSFAMHSLEYRVPSAKSVSILADTRTGKLEPSSGIEAPYVVSFCNPFRKKDWVSIPVSGSSTGLRRLSRYGKAASFSLQVTENRKLRVTASFKKKLHNPAEKCLVGVDVGISDCLHTSDGNTYGTLEPALSFYRDRVEPAFAYLSDLRNKKRNILHYVRCHDLPADVRRSLIRKADRLEDMIREAEAPYRKKRHYHQMVDHEIRTAVDQYIRELPKGTITVVETLDMKEFDKSRKVNAMFSTFARGKLQDKLMEELNWHGYGYIQIEPDYTSQVCPVCHKLDKASRNGKDFHCTCCGHRDDADHVGSLNIRERAKDNEILDICEKYRYRKKDRQSALRELYEKRNREWLDAQKKKK